MENKRNIIALLTDFGTKDFYVGAMKGVILSINKSAKIIDIAHEVPRHNIRSAAFTLDACYRNFPNKTIFVAIVDPGVGSNRRAILVETEKYYFIAPDNGLLSFVFDNEENFRVYELTNGKFFLEPISQTFHGRDIFSPAAAHLSNGFEPSEFGNEINDFIYKKIEKLKKIDNETIEAKIIHADHFGNLIVNARFSDLPEKFTIEFNNKKIKKIKYYFAGEKFCEVFMIFGSAGFLEIVANQDSAENFLNAKVGQKVLIKV